MSNRAKVKIFRMLTLKSNLYNVEINFTKISTLLEIASGHPLISSFFGVFFLSDMARRYFQAIKVANQMADQISKMPDLI